MKRFACLTCLIFAVSNASLLAQDMDAPFDPVIDNGGPGQGMVFDSGETSPTFELGSWVTPSRWERGFEVGINGSAGNSETFNLRAGLQASRKTDLVEANMNLVYAKSSVSNVETQNFGQFDLNINRLFAEDSPWSLFFKNTLLYDEFRPFDLRLALNGGLGYKWIDNEQTLFRTRFGAGVSREFGGVNNDWIPEAVFGIDLNHQISERQKIVAKIDYFPSWSNFDDYRIVSDLGWEILVDEATNMSLKLSLLDIYDSTPDGAKPNDINYGLLLLWKYKAIGL